MALYARSPRILLANWISFGMIVTRLAWIAHKLVSSNKPVKYASDASCNAKTACDWNRKSVLKSWAISLTKRWNGNLRIKSSVDFWYFLFFFLVRTRWEEDGQRKKEKGREERRRERSREKSELGHAPRLRQPRFVFPIYVIGFVFPYMRLDRARMRPTFGQRKHSVVQKRTDLRDRGASTPRAREKTRIVFLEKNTAKIDQNWR